MNRRDFLAATVGSVALAASDARGAEAPHLTPREEIERIVGKARPSAGGAIPKDLSRRLGTTHYAGKYHLTGEPFLIEGCNRVRALGMDVVKLWFDRRLPGYNYNSTWDLPRDAGLVDVARHAYFRQAFEMPFSTIVLEIQHVGNYGGNWRRPAASFEEDEKQFYELTKHLLQTYRDREVLFILQHWEGDWMVRDFPGQMWDKDRPADAEQRLEVMARWLGARQRGVSRGRAEAGPSRCRVEHAAEVNRVLDGPKGIPTLLTHVLPKVGLDRVSWSCYDGMGSAADLWHGIELIRAYSRPSEGRAKAEVYIGEVGLPERERTEKQVLEFWDMAMGVFFAMDVPHIIAWELYCNEVQNKQAMGPVFKEEDLRGFWLVKPNGELGTTGRLLTDLLKRAREGAK